MAGHGHRPAVTRQGVVFVAPNPSVDRSYEVERLSVGEIQRPTRAIPVPGGKSLNAARAAARFGVRVAAVGISQGTAGAWIEAGIAAAGIDANWIRSKGETRTCVSILDRSDGRMTELYEDGTEITPTVWSELERQTESVIDASPSVLVAMSGSLPPGSPRDGYERLARIAANHGCEVLLDTHGPALRAALEGPVAVVKVNRSEASDLVGREIASLSEAARAAGSLRGLGPATAIITLGPEGAVVSTSDRVVHVRAAAQGGPYSVGSGDVFFGAFAAGLLETGDVVQASGWGVAAATANTLELGTGQFDVAFARSLVDKIVVQDL
jgi:1-phosphofructokinase family hexose kinase